MKSNLEIWLDFITSILTSLPLLIALFIIVFKKTINANLAGLLKRITELKIGDKSVSFGEALATIDTEKVNSLNVEPNEEKIGKVQQFYDDNEFLELAKLRPDYAILDSWNVVDKALEEIGKLMPNKMVAFSNYKVINLLSTKELITSDQANFINENRILRDSVIHNRYTDLSVSDAILYRNNCIEILILLSSIMKDLNQENP